MSKIIFYKFMSLMATKQQAVAALTNKQKKKVH